MLCSLALWGIGYSGITFHLQHPDLFARQKRDQMRTIRSGMISSAASVLLFHPHYSFSAFMGNQYKKSM